MPRKGRPLTEEHLRKMREGRERKAAERKTVAGAVTRSATVTHASPTPPAPASMNQDAIMFLVTAADRMHKVYELLECKVEDPRQGTVYKQFMSGKEGGWKDLTEAEAMSRIRGFLSEYEGPTAEAAKAVAEDLKRLAGSGETGFYRGSRERQPQVVFRSHVKWLHEAVGTDKWNVGRAMLADLPALWTDICRDLQRRV